MEKVLGTTLKWWSFEDPDSGIVKPSQDRGSRVLENGEVSFRLGFSKSHDLEMVLPTFNNPVVRTLQVPRLWRDQYYWLELLKSCARKRYGNGTKNLWIRYRGRYGKRYGEDMEKIRKTVCETFEWGTRRGVCFVRWMPFQNNEKDIWHSLFDCKCIYILLIAQAAGKKIKQILNIICGVRQQHCIRAKYITVWNPSSSLYSDRFDWEKMAHLVFFLTLCNFIILHRCIELRCYYNVIELSIGKIILTS